MQTTSKDVRLTSFDANALNTVLDSLENESNKDIAATDNSIKNAVITSENLTSSEWRNSSSGIVAYDSTQGLEFSDGNAVYVSSGQAPDEPIIGKTDWGFSSVSRLKLTGFTDATEIEGLQLKGDYVHVNLTDHNNHQSSIYTVAKSDF